MLSNTIRHGHRAEPGLCSGRGQRRHRRALTKAARLQPPPAISAATQSRHVKSLLRLVVLMVSRRRVIPSAVGPQCTVPLRMIRQPASPQPLLQPRWGASAKGQSRRWQCRNREHRCEREMQWEGAGHSGTAMPAWLSSLAPTKTLKDLGRVWARIFPFGKRFRLRAEADATGLFP
jgi:hypothetical protein